MARPRLQIEIRGLKNMEVKLSRWQAKKISAVRALVKKTANNVRRNARRRAPIQTGRLRKSIQVKFGDNKLSAYVRAVAPYSHIVEYGSAATGAQPRPFLQPAFDGQKSKFEQQLRKILEEV